MRRALLSLEACKVSECVRRRRTGTLRARR
jgi:hypothetical protein